jgi:hypothetical protein
LVGKIRDLVQYAGNGWRRREIIVKQRNDGYPAIGQNIKLLDSSGITLGAFSFIKDANRKGYTCLGQPGRLRAWFEQHYPGIM